VAGEVALALYALAAAGVAWATGNTGSIPFLLLYGAAFGLVAGLSLAEMIGPRARTLLVGRRPTRPYKL
jgi:nitrous oxide reductase accessory protein NosL